MKKTLIVTLALALGLTTVCAASPLKNYDAGKVALDLGLTVPTNNNYEGASVGSKKTAPYAGITVGGPGKTAVNYKWNQYKNSGSTKVEAQQLNLMYKVLPYSTFTQAMSTVMLSCTATAAAVTPAR